jgi:putative radical SAM enzyme (TIGR03279 family)
MKEKDERRIIEYRLSPLYVSVHATPWEARKVLLNNPRVPDIKEQLRRLVEGGIQFHGQMVVVPGLNDGDVLEQTLSDLWDYGDACLSVALVPVGLTQFSHLYTGRSMDRAAASSLVDVTERWAERAERERGFPWVYGADELYLLAERDLPAFEHYGDFAQIENGIGSITMLRHRLATGLERLPRLDGKRIAVVTGVSMAPHMPALLEQLAQATGAVFDLRATPNSLFGQTVTTAGLLVGADIARALADGDGVDFALIPAETINEDGIFLDDVVFAELRDRLPMPVFPSYDFIDVLELQGQPVATVAGDFA